MKNDVDAYIAAAPKEVQAHLRRLRAIIKEEAPNAEERISYQMPYYRYLGHLVYFAGFKDHVSLFPAGYTNTRSALTRYVKGKGTYQFRLDEPLPEAEIRDLVRTRVTENDAKAKPTGSAAHASRKPR
ncbi:MAG TPA: DUF1801 domain-containing protein [Candidatus Dormibacteraeota bacterium]|nr:DUF1801 domain-containing protein [Candidatus Dormibacteraeota bacterium]